jgi:hypothetical protein
MWLKLVKWGGGKKKNTELVILIGILAYLYSDNGKNELKSRQRNCIKNPQQATKKQPKSQKKGKKSHLQHESDHHNVPDSFDGHNYTLDYVLEKRPPPKYQAKQTAKRQTTDILTCGRIGGKIWNFANGGFSSSFQLHLASNNNLISSFLAS